MAKVSRAARVASRQRVETLGNGTNAATAKVIAAAETGELYFIDISSNTCVVKLPVPRAGMYFKFVLAVASNNEATKDFAIITDATGTDMHGGIMVNGAIEEVAARSTIQLDTSSGAATSGDFIECISDGTAWYVFGNIDTASALVLNNNHSLS